MTDHIPHVAGMVGFEAFFELAVVTDDRGRLSYFRPQDLPEMRGRLRDRFGWEGDLIEKEALRNPFGRHEILKTHRAVYAA